MFRIGSQAVGRQLVPYRTFSTVSRVLEMFGVRRAKLNQDVFAKLLKPLFTGSIDGITDARTLTGMVRIDLDETAYPALRALRKELLPEDKAEPRAAVAVVDGIKNGHAYGYSATRIMSESFAACLMRTAAASTGQPLLGVEEIPVLTLSAFPGSANTTNSRDTARRLEYRMSSGELVARSTPDEEPVKDRAEFQLLYGNYVDVVGMSSISTPDLQAFSWINFTTERHALDGWVRFFLEFNWRTRRINLECVGFGQHPLPGADEFNPYMGAAVFTTMLDTLLLAIEKYLAAHPEALFDRKMVEEVTKSLDGFGVIGSDVALALKHLCFEMLNVPGIALAQWPRMIVGGHTTGAPAAPRASGGPTTPTT